ncbi:MAG TPA: hypothetical protein VJ842_06270 [Pyrinomonadaceae bacterium]|nr:hypothetical protein [Pyrinomonadaceae bacterium]
MRPIYTLILLVILLPVSSVSGQGTSVSQPGTAEARKAFVDQALNRVSQVFNQRESQLINQQAQRKAAESAALQNLVSINVSRGQLQQVAGYLARIEQAISQKSIVASPEFGASVRRERGAAEAQVAELAQREEEAKNELALRQEEFSRGENELRALIARNSEIKGGLNALRDNWLSHQTAENFNTLLGAVTATANSMAVTSNVDIISQDKAGRTAGARVRFEGDDERRQGKTPRFSCVTVIDKPCTETNVGVGYYYFWTERDNKATSDKNFGKFILDPVVAITLVEDR